MCVKVKTWSKTLPPQLQRHACRSPVLVLVGGSHVVQRCAAYSTKTCTCCIVKLSHRIHWHVTLKRPTLSAISKMLLHWSSVRILKLSLLFNLCGLWRDNFNTQNLTWLVLPNIVDALSRMTAPLATIFGSAKEMICVSSRSLWGFTWRGHVVPCVLFGAKWDKLYCEQYVTYVFTVT